MASTDARPLPIKNTAYRLTFPIYKSDGTLITGATGLDSEVSKDAGTFADCTNEATEIATSSGVYYLDITSTEMNADCVAIVVKTSSTGAVPPVFILYPQESGDVKVDVQSYGGTAGTFSAGRPEVNTTHLAGTSQTARDIGASVLLSNGTGTGQLKLASGYVAMTWADIAAPTTSVNLSGTTISTSQAVASVSGAVGSVTGNVGGSVASVTAVSSGAITEASFATTAGSFHPLGIIDQGTAQSATSTTLVLRSAAGFANDELLGCTVMITGGSAGVGQCRVITDYVGSTDTATVDTWTTTPTGTITYKILASPDAPAANATTLADAILTRQMTESYRADGAAPTLAQGICETLAHLGESSISGTTKTIKKFDGSTSAGTFTLDSSTTPTSITRAT